MNIPRSSSEQDDIVNSVITGIAVIELQFYHFPQTSDRHVLALSQTK